MHHSATSKSLLPATMQVLFFSAPRGQVAACAFSVLDGSAWAACCAQDCLWVMVEKLGLSQGKLLGVPCRPQTWLSTLTDSTAQVKGSGWLLRRRQWRHACLRVQVSGASTNRAAVRPPQHCRLSIHFHPQSNSPDTSAAPRPQWTGGAASRLRGCAW